MNYSIRGVALAFACLGYLPPPPAGILILVAVFRSRVGLVLGWSVTIQNYILLQVKPRIVQVLVLDWD
jgi:hypothetical protein